MANLGLKKPGFYPASRLTNDTSRKNPVSSGPDVTGATLGIIGLGRIGQAMARRARGFDMRILYYSRHRQDPEFERSLGVEYVEFDDLLQESDFVSLHTSLSSETYHLFSDRQFELMKSSAILINTARGPIVDSDALYRALANGQIAAGAIDVTEPEPIPNDSPLLTLDNLIITASKNLVKSLKNQQILPRKTPRSGLVNH